MKLARIRIEQLRRFGKPFELGDIAHGLNLFHGPNEAGKSTVVRAIRAAFFERYRTENVQDLVPHDDAGAAPTVELDFSIGGQAYALRKVWLKKKRCELSVGGRRLDGEEAEAHLAQLLGFGIRGKGASRADNWGIPGLLWIEQGAGHEIGDAIEHAADHLRSALKSTAAEVASTQGDAVIARVKKLREELVTEAKGTPRGEFAKVLDERARLDEECARLDQAATEYGSQLDELATLAAVHTTEQSAKPWEAMRQQQAAAQARLRATELRTAELRTQAEAAQRIEQQIASLNASLDAFDDKQKALQTRRAAVAEAVEATRAASTACTLWDSRQRDAETQCAQTQSLLATAETQDLRTVLQQQCEGATHQLELLGGHLSAAEREAAQLQAALEVQAESNLPPAAMQALKDRHTRLRELQIRREALQTRIEFDIDAMAASDHVTLDGERLQGSGQRSIEAAATLTIAGVGSVRIVPGQSDAAQLAREEATLQAAQAAEFARHGIATLADAQARQLRHAQALADVAQARKSLAQLAPDGLDALRAAHVLQQRHLSEAAQRLQALQAAHGLDADMAAAAPLPLAQARAHRDAADATRSEVSAQAQRAHLASAGAQARHELAQTECAALEVETSAPAYLQRHEAARHGLRTLQMEQQTLRERIALQRHEIEGADSLEALTLEVQRFEKSAVFAHEAFLRRDQRITHLRAQLEAAGAQGLDERRAHSAAQLAQLQRREQQMSARAAALTLLLELLTEQRQAATQRLQAPLQKHVTRYLQQLFPGAQLDIAENLQPTVLTRAQGAPNAIGSPLDALSFGAREQMGVLSRLAYADLLKEAGRPTLVILDDALVHSDGMRLAQMKRVIFDAAQRHQVLLFTCHPELWRDAGAPLRAIGAA